MGITRSVRETQLSAMAFRMRLLMFLSLLLMVAARVDRNQTQVYGFAKGSKFQSTLGPIADVRVFHRSSVTGLQIRHEFGNWTFPVLGSASNMFTEISFGYPEEALVQIKGSFGPTSSGELGITKLSLVTFNYLLRSTTTYGPFGGGHFRKNQTHFQSPRKNVKQVTGFSGYTNSLKDLCALSLIYEPGSLS